MAWLAWIALALLGATVALAVYAVSSFRWAFAEAGEDRYFSRTLADRRALKAEFRRRARRLAPLVRIGAPIARALGIEQPLTVHRGVVAPRVMCPPARFEAAARLVPEPGDVFVATQMKCGTTWMQQIVYETLCRGRGDLSDAGLRHMYALSPWIEANGSVPIARAARVGSRGQRILKTHFPASLCPYGEDARYVYVTRHPYTCFASCVDFVRLNAGPLAPPHEKLLDWFCSDQMWWSPWPEHVDGWWRWAEERENVLFVHYEHMLDDLDAAVREVASFLDVELSADERGEVVRKSGYDYMKANEEHFEMAAPTLFQSDGSGLSFFQSGEKGRDRALSEADRARIAAFCRERLEHSPYPLAKFYPDLA